MPEDSSRILLVEDEGLVCMLLEDLLADMGCDIVGPAVNIDEAEALASREAFDFALLDVNLGSQNSFSVADILSRRGIPYAFLTGYGVEGVRKDLRAAPVLLKPIDVPRLEQMLEAFDLI
ncbi:MAG: response regulator [Caulobacteraceae bacterium]|nr:response regulator [Caulobacteraceae bacterium]